MQSKPASKAAIKILKAWIKRHKISMIGSVYVFGSSISQDGGQFDHRTSDLDILIVLKRSSTDVQARLAAAENILKYRVDLETLLMRELARDSSNKPIASIILATPEEVQLNIHKTTPGGFFGGSDFLDVISGKKEPFSNFHLFDRHQTRGAIACISAAQKQRHWFLSTSANGTRQAKDWDSDSEPLPKELIRSAAQLRYCMEGLDDKTEFDGNRGLDFCSAMIERSVKSDQAAAELRNWLSVRRGGRGDRTPLSPREHLAFYEYLSQEASVWLLEHIRVGAKTGIADAVLRSVAVIATTEDLGNERAAVVAFLKRTPGIGDVCEIRAEEADGLRNIPEGALRLVLLGWRTGGTATLETALKARDNVIVVVSKAIEPDRVDIDELTQILALRKPYASTQTFTNANEAVAVAQDQVADWLARQSSNNVSERINLNSWEATYLRQRLPTWEQGHHGPLQARRSKDQRLDRAQLYVSLRVDSEFCFEEKGGKLIVLPANKKEAPDQSSLSSSHDEGKRRATFLERAVSHPDLPHLVIEGEAGSGKTVLLQHIAFTLASYHLARPLPPNAMDLEALAQKRPLVPVPLFLEARALSENLAKFDGVAGLVNALEKEIGKATGQAHPNDDILEGLRAGRYLLLVDSLDEVPTQEGRDAVARCLAGVSNQEWRSTFVLTTRPTAYTGSVTFGGKIRQIRIAHLDAVAVRMMVQRWSLFHNYGSDEQETLLAAVNEVAARHGGANMAENPLLLTVTMLVYDQQERLPDSTAELYKRIVEILCETRKSDLTPATRRQLLELTFEGAQRAGGTTWGVEEAVEWLRRSRPDVFASNDAARAMLDRLGIETGLILFEGRSRTGAEKQRRSSNRSKNRSVAVVLRPWHRSFQEYLAACRLASGVESVSRETDRLFEGREGQPAIVEDPTWEGVLRFLVGIYGDQGVGRARAYIERLHDHFSGERSALRTTRPGRVLGLVASGLTAYQEYFRRHPLREQVKTELHQAFEQTGTTWPLVDRLLALEELGRLGDPRLNSPRWIEVPGGLVTYNRSRSEPHIDGEMQRRATVSTFYVLWSPVTVHDYRPFVENGYADEQWWDPEAVVAFGLTDNDSGLSEESPLPGMATENPGRVGLLPTAPLNWARQIHHPNHPVVGVSWYEARAFCRWATANWSNLPGGGTVGLPSEDEWQYAAYGSVDSAYPWGIEPVGKGDAARVSYVIGGAPDVATPVGAFPLGNRNGIVDLVGNVWEWCQDTKIMGTRGQKSGRHRTTGDGQLALSRGPCGHGFDFGVEHSSRRDFVPMTSRASCSGFRVVCRGVPISPKP